MSFNRTRYKNKLEATISNKVGRVIHHYRLIEHGDRILIGLSGGRDSLSLLHFLNLRQSFAPIKFDIAGIHVKNNYLRTSQKTSDYLFEFCSLRNIEYIEEDIDIVSTNKKKKINCFWCAWNRRKAIFLSARNRGFNKIAFGHHMDDIIETQLMNLFYHSEISTMPVKLSMFGGELTIIRPLAYVSKKNINEFAALQKFHYTKCSCPKEDLTKRKSMRDIIELLYKENHAVKSNIFNSLKNIKPGYLNNETTYRIS